MSEKYDEYLNQHRNNVYEGFLWMKKNIPEIFSGDNIIADIDYQIRFSHDRSKNSPEEYAAYDAYFYGNNKSYEVVEAFNLAWLHHIHFNPHHWQHWILNNDDPEKGEILLQMPDICIVEMICDWWSFSWAKGDLFEIFNWYNEHKNYVKLNQETRQKVEKILDIMKKKLEEIKNNQDNDANIVPPNDGGNVTMSAIENAMKDGADYQFSKQINMNDILGGIAGAIGGQAQAKMGE